MLFPFRKTAHMFPAAQPANGPARPEGEDTCPPDWTTHTPWAWRHRGGGCVCVCKDQRDERESDFVPAGRRALNYIRLPFSCRSIFRVDDDVHSPWCCPPSPPSSSSSPSSRAPAGQSQCCAAAVLPTPPVPLKAESALPGFARLCRIPAVPAISLAISQFRDARFNLRAARSTSDRHDADGRP